ncbi:CCA tRNA nucleotidyltransferase [Nioella aestuarii]|uniref:CCA tRNA nucleotidyltransferase n=1 Tax=Nioella aestuarii TaxID=1662864 RepID=UPI003D7F59DC
MILDTDWLHHQGTQVLCKALEAEGFHALFVGGCVRNGLLGLPTDDIDISTDARPERVMQIAEAAGLKAVPTGIDHGTVTVIADGLPHEVTTFRRDVETDGRRAVIAFADRVEEDAMRRDFTMNALYADAGGRVIDPLGTGVADLRARRLRFIGDPHDRIREDYLRILRFFRFHAHYGDQAGGLDADGLAACAEMADGIDHLSRERIGHEMRKLLRAADPAPSVAAMALAGILRHALPGADARALPVLVHAETDLGIAPDHCRRLAALGGDNPGDALRLSKSDARRVQLLRDAVGSMMGAGELGYREGFDTARDVLLLRVALLEIPLAQSELGAAQAADGLQLPVTAADLMAIGLQGPALGDRLREIEARWIASGFTLTRADLLP